jgi:transposase-like protein
MQSVAPRNGEGSPLDANLAQAIFTDETKARQWLESYRWPDGPVCPHCGSNRDRITGLRGKVHRPGVYQCNACREQFTVTVKTVFEKSKIPLSKWLTALFLMTASKKRISGHQVHRMLGVSYKSTWFMCHRLRAAMHLAKDPPLGGLEETVEVDETYIGKSGEPQKSLPLRQAGYSRASPSRCRRAFVSPSGKSTQAT